MTAAFAITQSAVAGHTATIVRFAYADRLNAALAQAILEREPDILATAAPQAVAGLDDGLTTRWQHFNVLTWPEPACSTLREGVLAGCAAWLAAHTEDDKDNALIALSCWANALRGDERLAAHNHAPAMLLGNYLVDAGGGSGGGTVYFGADGHTETLAPEPGRLVICAGGVRHAVERHYGPRPRLSVAFDAFVRRQNPLLSLGLPDAMAQFRGPRWLTFEEEATA